MFGHPYLGTPLNAPEKTARVLRRIGVPGQATETELIDAFCCLPIDTACDTEGNPTLLVNTDLLRRHAFVPTQDALDFDGRIYHYLRTDVLSGKSIFAAEPTPIAKIAENWPIGGDRPE